MVNAGSRFRIDEEFSPVIRAESQEIGVPFLVCPRETATFRLKGGGTSNSVECTRIEGETRMSCL